MRTLHVVQPGRMAYEAAVQLQRDLVERLRQEPDGEDGRTVEPVTTCDYASISFQTLSAALRSLSAARPRP